MLSDEVRARLARLTASLSPGSVAPFSSQPSATQSPSAHAANPRAVSAPAFTPVVKSPPAGLAGVHSLGQSATLFEQAELCANGSGEHWRFRRPLAELADLGEQSPARAGSSNLPADLGQPLEHPELAALARHFPDRALFLDLETCGFAGSPIFLAGVVWRCEGVLVLDQLFARHYGEERALLETFWSLAERLEVLATFNGKSFDWPMVRDRTTRHRLRREKPSGSATPAVHCDLLHHARRRWKTVLPDCKLQTLERFVCRRVRHNDLPGSEVPAAYHQFVRTGAGQPIQSILHHNALDLLTLVQITLKLIRPAAPARWSQAG